MYGSPYIITTKSHLLIFAQEGVRLLREALSLAPQNPVVLATLHALQEDAKIPALSKVVHRFAVENETSAGEEALRLLRDPYISVQDSTAAQCVELLLSRIDQVSKPACGKIIVGLLRVSSNAREHIAGKLSNDHENILAVFQNLGGNTIEGIVIVLLDQTVWKQAGVNTKCLRECFKWFQSQLTTNKDENTSTYPVARLLAGMAEDLHSSVSQEGLDRLLRLLDPTSPDEFRTHVALAIAKFIETSGDIGQSMVTKFIASRLAADGDDDLRLAFAVAAAIFPLTPHNAAQLFLMDGFIDGLVDSLQARPMGVERSALEMLSAACVDKACRDTIATHCTQYLEALVKSGDNEKSIAAVILTKVKYSVGEPRQGLKTKDIDKLATVFKEIMVKDDLEARESSVEGLAYTSLKGSVKQTLIKDQKFVRCLIETLRNSTGKPAVMFGVLTVIAHLTAYPPTLSEEEQKVAELKNYAEAKARPKIELDAEDKDEMVTPRCKALIDSGVVPALVACSKKTTPRAITMIFDIILSLSKNQKHRGMIAQQGGVKLCLQFYASSTDDSAQACLVQQTSAHALGRILVSVNPSHIFSSQLAISSTVRPLFRLLDDTDDRKDLLAVFEGLLALTNLASTDHEIRDQIIRVCWTKVEELLLHDNAMIQRAAVELVCNLMASTSGVTKFADGSKPATNRLHILLALADAEDFATRRAAGGALAMLTEWDMARDAVMARKRGVEIVLDMVAEDSEEMRHRGVVIIKNLVCGKVEYAQKVKDDGGSDILREALKNTRNPEVLGHGVEALKQLVECQN
jgi:hypothetical protein